MVSMNKIQDRYQQVAQLHVQGIHGGFLSALGTRFVALMYEALDSANGSVLLTEEREGRVVGFVAGGCGLRPIYQRMFRSPLRLTWALFPSMLSVGRLCKMRDILRYDGGHSDAQLPQAELLSIAVDPDFRGTGVAEALYRRLSDAFRSKGLVAFRITVGAELIPAHRFYKRMGAIPFGEVEVHRGTTSTVFIQRLHAPSETERVDRAAPPS